MSQKKFPGCVGGWGSNWASTIPGVCGKACANFGEV